MKQNGTTGWRSGIYDSPQKAKKKKKITVYVSYQKEKS